MDQNKTENSIILPTDIFDKQVTRFFTQKLIIAHLAKKFVPEYANMTIDEIIAHLDKEYPATGNHIASRSGDVKDVKGRTIKTDILFDTTPPGSDKPIPIVINLEPQNNPNPGYPLVSRGIYYVSRLISIQEHGENIDDMYRTLHKVYSIWICYNIDKNSLQNQNTIQNYRLVEEAIYGNPKAAAKSAYDKEQICIISLGKYDEVEQGSLLRMLDVVFANDEELTAEQKSDIFKREYNIKSDAFEKEVTELNAYVYDNVQRAIAKNNLDWQIKLDKVMAKAEAEAKAKDEAMAKAEAAQKDAAMAKAESTLAQKLLAAKRYADLDNMFKDTALRQKLFAEFGLN